MVIGQQSSRVSFGNRVVFPKRFSAELGVQYIITKGLERNLLMVSEPDSHLLIEDINTKPYSQKEARDMQAFVLGSSAEVTLDGANRFVIPPHLMSFAGITDEVVFAGVQQFIQVWDAKQWNMYQDTIFQSIMERRKQAGDE